MSSAAWRASGRTRRAPATGREPGSWGLAVERAREAWDGLTGGPEVMGPDGAMRYGTAAADAILGLALALWADTAATMGDGRE